MSVSVKICGINSRVAMEAAVASGADFVGFIFYPPSPRYLDPADFAQLAALVPPHIKKVGVFVDPDPMEIDDVLQFHGTESPRNMSDLRVTFRLPVVKAIKVAKAEDLDAAQAFEGHVDWLMFDAKAPDEPGLLPGGNALSFDWTLLAGRSWKTPWFLSGGLNPDNLAEAVRLTGAPAVDVSSGVEVRPGLKDPDRITDFLKIARSL